MAGDKNILKILPSKKFILGTVLAFLLAAGGIFYVLKTSKTSLKYETPKPIKTKQLNNDVSFLYNRGDDVGGATINKKIIKEDVPEIIQEKNLTEEFITNTFIQKNQEVKNFLENTAASLKDELTNGDLKTFSEDKLTDKIFYLKEAVNILNGNFGKINGNELEIVADSLKQNNPELMKKLDDYIFAYQKSADDFKNLTVPQNTDYQKQHLLLINIMRNLEISVSGLKIGLSDPVKMILGLRWYLNEAKRWKFFEKNFETLALKTGLNLNKDTLGNFVLK